MDPRKLSFLQAVVGEDGARALSKATAQSPDLEWAILPRVVMAWLEVVAHGDYDDALPGVEDTRLTFKKSETEFSGCINIDGDAYTFRDASLYHVAGSVAVALGGDEEHAPPLRSPALARFGRSVDLLVKARTLRKMQDQGGARGIKLPGAAAAPRGPQPPTPPTPEQEEQVDERAGTSVAGKPKKPGKTAGGTAKPVKTIVKPAIKKPTMKVTKAEALASCPACGGRQFDRERYVGCLCFKDLAKSVQTISSTDGQSYTLSFGSSWDAEAIATLAENLGK